MGNRYYPVGDKEYASVTTITGLADKSDALIPWAVNCAITYVLTRLKRLFKLCIKYYKRDGLLHMLLWLFAELRRILNEARTEWRTVRDEAGDIGTQVHDALEAWLVEMQKGGDPQPENYAPEDGMAAKLFYAAYHKIMGLGPFTVLATEQKVVNEDEWYAGRFDALLEVNGETWLIDFKTGASFYPEWGMQLAAYAEAWEKSHCDRCNNPDKPGICYYCYDDEHPVDRIKVLRLDKKTLKAHWKEYGDDKDVLTRADYFRAFLGLRDYGYLIKFRKAAKLAFMEGHHG